MTELTETSFEQTRKDFLSFLKYTKGHCRHHLLQLQFRFGHLVPLAE